MSFIHFESVLICTQRSDSCNHIDLIIMMAVTLMSCLFTEIPLPSTQYHLEVKDTKTCSLEPAKSMVYGEALGNTEIMLRDKSEYSLIFCWFCTQL